MCGICGIIQVADARIDRGEVVQMRDALAHRGPDAAGVYCDESVGLGHRRLKIIDLSEAAAQPMTNEDGSLVLIFNGEIYNFQPLRDELKARGHQFRCNSDTEVILHGYEEWGIECVQRFNGMFAFALYDRRHREVLLVRDRLGIKPVYYVASPQRFLFASEIKAFASCRDCQLQLNDSALVEQLLFRNPLEPRTLFRNVHSLLPGHWMLIRPDLSYSSKSYWDIPLQHPEAGQRFEAEEEKVLALLKESVALQEISDVPIGVQLSGGTDSSLVTALMSERANQPLTTFSVGFNEHGYDELPYARRVSNLLRTQHHEIVVSNSDFTTALERLSWQRDLPLVHANSAGIYWLCQKAKPLAPVLLTGEGADEIFGGYYRYKWLQRCLLAKQYLPTALAHVPLSPNWSRIGSLQQALIRSLPQLILRGTAIGYDAFSKHLDPQLVSSLNEERINLLAPTAGHDWLSQALYYDCRTFLPGLLIRQDTMSMAHGVESRVPFLDHRLVELAFRLPSSFKVDHRTSKRIVKQIAARYLPQDLLYRPKMGFGFPLAPWMNHRPGLGDWLDALTEPNGLCANLLDRRLLRRLVRSHRMGVNNAEPLWTLITLEAWYRACFQHTPASYKPERIHLRPQAPAPVLARKFVTSDQRAESQPIIAHIVLSLQVGGLERVVVNLVRGLQQAGHRTIVCCLETRGEFAKEVERMGIPLYCFEKGLGFDWKVIGQMAEVLRREHVNIVHTHNLAPHFHGLAAAKLARVPVCVHTRHGRHFPKTPRKAWLNRVLSWGTDVIVPVSDDAAAVALNVEHVNARRVHRIWNGVDATRYQPVPYVAERGPIIGTVARLSPDKDYSIMLQAFQLVLRDLPAARLIMVGDGPCGPGLQAEARQLGILPNTDFLGERSDILELLHTFALFSLSSITEGLSMSMLEAMAAGLPIVATDVGGNREIVNPPECGLIVPARNPRALADAYLTLLRDPDRRIQMSAAARNRVVDEFSVERMIQHYVELYQDLIDKEWIRQ